MQTLLPFSLFLQAVFCNLTPSQQTLYESILTSVIVNKGDEVNKGKGKKVLGDIQVSGGKALDRR